MTCSRTKILSICVFCFAAVALVACGVPDAGEWTAPPPASPGVTPEVPSEVPVEVEITPPTGVGDYSVYCQVPSAWSYPYLLEEPETVPFYRTSEENVCLGNEGGTDGNKFCNWVTRNEARYKAIALCYQSALQELENQGRDSFGSLEGWLEKRSTLVSDLWDVDPMLATYDVGHFAGWIALLMNDGITNQVDAEPFCFTNRGNAPEDAKLSTISSLWWLWQVRDAKEEGVLGGLKRGVKLSVSADPDVPQLDVTVLIEEIEPTAPLSENCAFRLPPAE